MPRSMTDLSKRHRITDGKRLFRLAHADPADTAGFGPS
jgi:hypothetical protein